MLAKLGPPPRKPPQAPKKDRARTFRVTIEFHKHLISPITRNNHQLSHGSRIIEKTTTPEPQPQDTKQIRGTQTTQPSPNPSPLGAGARQKHTDHPQKPKLCRLPENAHGPFSMVEPLTACFRKHRSQYYDLPNISIVE